MVDSAKLGLRGQLFVAPTTSSRVGTRTIQFQKGAKASTTCGFVGLVRTNHEPLILLLIPCATGVALIALIHVSPPIISIAWGSPPTFASSVCAHCCRLCVSAN